VTAVASYPSPSSDLLGQRLLNSGVINPRQLQKALTIQSQSGGKIGEILYSLGACNSLSLHQHLAEQQSLPFADLLHEAPEPSLLNEKHLPDYLALQLIPWRREADGTVLIACLHPTVPLMEWAVRHFPHHRFALTSRLDINRFLALHFSEALGRLSRNRLWELSPAQSARQTLANSQRLVLTGILGAISVGLAAAPQPTLLWLFLIINSFYLLTLGFKTLLFITGKKHRERIWHEDRHDLTDADLPLYSILVPMYREAGTVPQLLASLRALDYPASKLDIKLVLEADDTETLAAVKAA
jgi:glycosyltransferase XagB